MPVLMLLFFWQILSHSNAANTQNDSLYAMGLRDVSDDSLSSSHVRRKRYAIFPEGSTFTVAICVTLKLLTPDYDIFTEAVNWALTYDLPESVQDYDKNLYGSSPPIQARRRRSRFFRKIETFINRRGLNGRACILRSLCEVTQLLPDNDGFLEAIIKLLFRMPLQKVFASEPVDHYEYDLAYRLGFKSRNTCSDMFSVCPLSIIRLLLSIQRSETTSHL